MASIALASAARRRAWRRPEWPWVALVVAAWAVLVAGAATGGGGAMAGHPALACAPSPPRRGLGAAGRLLRGRLRGQGPARWAALRALAGWRRPARPPRRSGCAGALGAVRAVAMVA